ncbi:MAG: hypothetical protein IIC60_01665 [Proteobacteria bacterium]|nr:hypothetical protein [Pseudomonadota bacterium]
MDFNDDIRVGDELLDDLDADQPLRREAGGCNRNRFELAVALTVSALLHIAIVLALLYLNIGDFDTAVPPRSTVRIQLLPADSLKPEPQLDERELRQQVAALEDEAKQQATEDVAMASEPTAEFIEEIEPVDPVTLAAASEPDEIQIDSSASPPPATSLALPSAVAVQQILEELAIARQAHFYSYDCNPLEEEEGIRECEPTDRRDYSVLDRNPVYDYHNPRRQRSRSRETVATGVRESAGLVARLALTDLPPGMVDYLMQEVEIGIGVYSHTGNRAVQLMNRMADRSAAAQMAEDVLNLWVQNQMRILNQHKYYTKQDIDAMAKQAACHTLEIVTLSPRELANCLLVGNNPAVIFQLIFF